MPQSLKRSTIVVRLDPRSEPFTRKLLLLAQSLPNFDFLVVVETLDETAAAIVETIVSEVSNIEVVTLPVAFGKGAALRMGVGRTSAELIACLDLDSEVAPRDIRAFFDRLESDPKLDIVIGNRWVDKDPQMQPHRRFASDLFRRFSRVLFGLSVHDPQSPLKAFRRNVVPLLFDDLRLYNLGFDVELMFQARRHRLVVCELPLRVPSQHEYPLVRTGLGVTVALVLVRLMNSPLSVFPPIAWLGRHYTIPVKSRYRILIFCWRDPKNPSAGGGEVYLFEQATRWAQNGHEVTWFAQAVPGQPSTELVGGIKVVRWLRAPWVFLGGGLWYLFRSERKFDFIVDCMNGIPFFTPLFSTKPKVCLVYHLHSAHFRQELFWPLSAIAQAVETRLAPFIYRRTQFMTISESTKAELEKHNMSRFPISIVHSGVAPELAPGRKADAPTILYLGRLRRYKRVDNLIEAFERMKPEIPGLQLVIAGSGDDEDRLKSIVQSKCLEGIRFEGRVDEAAKVRLMQEAWVFGMPSSLEGWGIVVIEAAAAATPTVAFNVDGLRDCIRNGETGFLCTDHEEFVLRLKQLLQDSDIRNDMSSRAHAWAQAFSWDGAAERTLERIRMSQPWRAVFEPGDGNRVDMTVIRPALDERGLPVKSRIAKQHTRV